MRQNKIYSSTDKLEKMIVLKIFDTVDIYHFGFASLTEELWNWAKQLSKACYWKLFWIELVYLL